MNVIGAHCNDPKMKTNQLTQGNQQLTLGYNGHSMKVAKNSEDNFMASEY